MGIYDDVARRLLARCQAYRDREITLESLQHAVSDASDAIVAAEESDVRQQLLAAEARLEEIRFTVSTWRVRRKAMDVVSNLEALLRDYLPAKAP